MFSRLTPALPKSWVRNFSFRAPDFEYLEKGKTHPAYFEAFRNHAKEMGKYPQLMKQYFKTASVMRQKGKISFLHAQSASLRVPRLFIEALRKKKNADFFRYLRHPSPEFSIDMETLKQRVEDYVKKHGDVPACPDYVSGSRLDVAPELQKHLVSVSYSMMDFTNKESAFDYLFQNGSALAEEEAREFSQNILKRFLCMRGKRDQIKQVLQALEPLFDAYANFEIGTLYVIGIPEEKLDEFVYDSKAFGIPTRKKVSEVVKALGESSRAYSSDEGGLQARIMVHKETLNPDSGVEVVDVNDPDEVARFCEEYEVKDPQKVDAFRDIFENPETGLEKRLFHRLKGLDEKVKSIALEVGLCY